MARLFGVKLPQTTRYELRSKISSLQKDTKNVIYWHYSEFFLRANRNPWYKNVLNRASFAAIDGKGLQWAFWKISKADFLPWLYGKVFVNWFIFLRIPIFLCLFILQLFYNFLLGSYLLLSRFNFSVRTKNQVILGRDFVYELLKIAEENNWKTIILGGSKSGGEVTKNLISHLFPKLQINFWTRPHDSDLMRDNQQKKEDLLALPSVSFQNSQNFIRLEGPENSENPRNLENQQNPQDLQFFNQTDQEKSPLREESNQTTNQTTNQNNFVLSGFLEKILLHSNFINHSLISFFSYFWPKKPLLTSENLYERFPDLLDAKDTIVKQKPDLVLVCIGGGSGKQEFFVDKLYQDGEVNFTLATGLGAAIDHLGGGAEQKEPPKWMQQAGLEWFYRILHQPYRIPRILDSIGTLWWWTTVEEFMKESQKGRETVVNIIYRLNSKNQKEYLLVERRNVLPGDVAWSFVQGGMSKKESSLEAGLREIEEEVGLSNLDFKVILTGQPGLTEPYTVSFWRFLAMKANASYACNYINLLEYTGEKQPVANWEHWQASWVLEEEVLFYLSPEKRADFQRIVLQM